MREDSFAFLPSVPPEHKHRAYCGPCFSAKVSPALDAYNETVQAAKEVFIFDKGAGEMTRLMRRVEKPLLIDDCVDRHESLLRLAFLAAKANFNALLDVEILPKKIRNEGYQTTKWQARGVPTRVDAELMNSDTREVSRR